MEGSSFLSVNYTMILVIVFGLLLCNLIVFLPLSISLSNKIGKFILNKIKLPPKVRVLGLTFGGMYIINACLILNYKFVYFLLQFR